MANVTAFTNLLNLWVPAVPAAENTRKSADSLPLQLWCPASPRSSLSIPLNLLRMSPLNNPNLPASSHHSQSPSGRSRRIGPQKPRPWCSGVKDLPHDRMLVTPFLWFLPPLSHSIVTPLAWSPLVRAAPSLLSTHLPFVLSEPTPTLPSSLCMILNSSFSIRSIAVPRRTFNGSATALQNKRLCTSMNWRLETTTIKGSWRFFMRSKVARVGRVNVNCEVPYCVLPLFLVTGSWSCWGVFLFYVAIFILLFVVLFFFLELNLFLCFLCGFLRLWKIN